MKPEYLGDAVYASVEHDSLVLTTDHHEQRQAGNVIILDLSTLAALERYLQRWKTEKEQR